MVTAYLGCCREAEIADAALVPAMQVASSFDIDKLRVAAPLLAFCAMRHTTGTALPPLLLANTVREHLVSLLRSGRPSAASVAALRALAQGVPYGHEILPLIATPLVHLTYHGDEHVRYLALLSVLQCVRAENDRLQSPEGDDGARAELAPVALERVREILSGDAPVDAGDAHACVHILRWSARNLSILLPLREAFTLLLRTLQLSDASAAVGLAAVAAARSVLTRGGDVNTGALLQLEDTLVRIFAQYATHPRRYGLGLECARALGTLWGQESVPPMAERVPHKNTPRAEHERSIVRFIRAHVTSTNPNVRSYIIDVLDAWRPLQWMLVSDPGDTLGTFGLSEHESSALLVYAESSDRTVASKVRTVHIHHSPQAVTLCEKAAAAARAST